MKLIFLLPSSQQSLQVDLDNELTYQKEQASFLNDQCILRPVNSSQQYPSFLFSFNYTKSIHSILQLPPFSICSSQSLHSYYLPTSMEGANLSIQSTYNQTITFECSNSQWHVLNASECECLSYIDKWGIDWPQSSKNTLLQKPCGEEYLGGILSWCNEECNWEILAGQCTHRSCKEEIGSRVHWNELPAGSIQTIQCTNQEGIAMQRKCGLQGEWEAIEYGECYCPQEDDWPITHSDNYAYHTCPPGYQGTISRRCNRFGEWSSVFYDCSSVMCPATQVGEISFPETLSGTISRQPCPYPFHGWLLRQCDSTGVWKDIISECESNSCQGIVFSLIHRDIHIAFQQSISFDYLKGSIVPHTIQPVISNTHSLLFSNLQPFIPYQFTIQAIRNEKVVSECIVGNIFAGYFCLQMEQPSLVSILPKKKKFEVSIKLFFSECKNREADQVFIKITGLNCNEYSSKQYSVDCSDLYGCSIKKSMIYKLPDLLPFCSYSITTLLLADDGDMSSLWSTPLLFTPSSSCHNLQVTLNLTSLSTQFADLSWSFSLPVTPNSGILRYRSSMKKSTLPLQAWSFQFYEICSSAELCSDKKSMTIPFDKGNIWYEFEIVFQFDIPVLCQTSQAASVVVFASPSPSASLSFYPSSFYYTIDIRDNSMPFYFAYVLENALGEIQLASQVFVPHDNHESIYVSNLHPNSHYFLSYNLIDFAGIVSYNRSSLFTTSMRNIEINITLYSEDIHNIVFSYTSSTIGLLYCSILSSLPSPLTTSSITDSAVNVGISSCDEKSFASLSTTINSTYLACYLKDLQDDFILQPTPVIHSLHLTPHPTIYPVFYSPPLYSKYLPFNMTVHIVFSSPVQLTQSVVSLIIVAYSMKLIRVLPTTIQQINSVEFSFQLISIQSDYETQLILPSSSIFIDPMKERPVVFDKMFENLPVLFTFTMEGSTYLSERHLSFHKPYDLLLEDILTLDYPIQYLKLVPSTIDLLSLTSPVVHSITIPHSCITIKTTDIGSTLSIHIQQCFPFLQIEQGYQLVFRSPILTINNRFITEPIPIYFYITGCMILFFFFSHI